MANFTRQLVFNGNTYDFSANDYTDADKAIVTNAKEITPSTTEVSGAAQLKSITFDTTAFNVVDTTYTAGTNVSISSDNVISATDTTYESKTAAESGTDVSLVTTGEKYTWNNKQNTLSYVVEDTTNSIAKFGSGINSGYWLESKTDNYISLKNPLTSVDLSGMIDTAANRSGKYLYSNSSGTLEWKEAGTGNMVYTADTSYPAVQYAVPVFSDATGTALTGGAAMIKLRISNGSYASINSYNAAAQTYWLPATTKASYFTMANSDADAQILLSATDNKDKYLHTNASTGVLEWGEVSGGSITGPTTSTVGHVAVWNATDGTVLKDVGIITTSAECIAANDEKFVTVAALRDVVGDILTQLQTI